MDMPCDLWSILQLDVFGRYALVTCLGPLPIAKLDDLRHGPAFAIIATLTEDSFNHFAWRKASADLEHLELAVLRC